MELFLIEGQALGFCGARVVGIIGGLLSLSHESPGSHAARCEWLLRRLGMEPRTVMQAAERLCLRPRTLLRDGLSESGKDGFFLLYPQN